MAHDLKHDRQVAVKPLFDSGEIDWLLYYVMPYVEGESLRALLDRKKQLPIDRALNITKAVASALDHAHRHGVGARLTETGMSLGTPEYMSPEQATGDWQLEPASDIYSLGAVLYEMLVGDPPHRFVASV